MPTFPDRDEWLRLHLRLLGGEATAALDVCRAWIGPLCAWLACRFSRADEHLRQSAAEDAILSYLKDPRRFDPERGDLAGYLCRAARGDLLNLLRKEGRLRENLVELAARGGNGTAEGDPARLAERREEAEAARAYLGRAGEDFSPGERRVLDLLLDGERDTDAFAEALGLDGLQGPRREREVKRAKDRVKKRLLRGGGR